MRKLTFLTAILVSLMLATTVAYSLEKHLKFETSKAEIKAAKKQYRKARHDYLAIVITDKHGKVLNIKKLNSKIKDLGLLRQIKQQLLTHSYEGGTLNSIGYYEQIVSLPITVNKTGGVIQSYVPEDIDISDED